MVNCKVLLLSTISVTASIAQAIALWYMDFPRRYLSLRAMGFISIMFFIIHLVFVIWLYARRISTKPRPRLGWRMTASIDILLVGLGIGFHFFLDTKTQSLVLAVALSLDAFVVGLMLYPIADIGVLDACNGVLIEVALNLHKLRAEYVLPSCLVLCSCLIWWRAYFIYKITNPDRSPNIIA